MFETSVVRERAAAQPRYSLLVMSVTVHTAVVIGIVAVSIHSVRPPSHPPNEIRLYFAPPPPPQPLGTPQARPQQPPAAPHAASAPHVATAPATVVAPLHIPDAIPTVAPSSVTPGTTPGSGDPNAHSDTIGVPNGDPNSVSSDITPAAVPAPVPETIFRPGGEVRPAVVLHRVEPAYPHSAAAIRLGGTIVLQCVVDKSGNVRDAQVVTSSHPAFNDPALAALRQWRFSPGVFHGKPVDTYFELTIRFESH
jgi:protein TonB